MTSMELVPSLPHLCEAGMHLPPLQPNPVTQSELTTQLVRHFPGLSHWRLSGHAAGAPQPPLPSQVASFASLQPVSQGTKLSGNEHAPVVFPSHVPAQALAPAHAGLPP
jgi:hypothetical protein